MSELFLKVLNLSFSATWVVLAVVLIFVLVLVIRRKMILRQIERRHKLIREG